MVDDISLMRRARAIAGQVLNMEQTHAATEKDERIDGLILLDIAAGSIGIDPLAFEADYIGLLGCAYRLITELICCRLNHESPTPVYDRLYGLNLPTRMIEEIYAAAEQVGELVAVYISHTGASTTSTMGMVEAEVARQVIALGLQIELQAGMNEMEIVLGRLQKYTRGHLKRIRKG